MSTLANVDVRESFDVRGIDRFPRSWIVLFEVAEESRPHEFIVGPVDKMGQEVRFEHAIRVDGEKIRVTYQIPPVFNWPRCLNITKSKCVGRPTRSYSGVMVPLADALQFGRTTFLEYA